jgi:TolB-like protein/Flp pilus assembly protein TadD
VSKRSRFLFLGDRPLADVFLSYARTDRPVAADVARSLEQAGFSVWWDREIRAGSDFALEIDREIAAARVVVVLWSDASQQSAWVRDEGAYGRDRQKLIPICLDDAEPPLGFRQVQSLRLGKAGDRNVVMAELAAAVRPFVSGEMPAQAAPREAPRSRPKRGAILTAIGIVVLVLTGLLVRELMNSAGPDRAATTTPSGITPHAVSQSDQSIAVLPFADMSENHDQGYLADGMSEEIINLLANAPDLLVAARTSSFHFKGKDTKVADIARELGVAHVLEGSIRRSSDHLRVTAQLIRADNGFHVWSETFDRELSDLFAVQDEIANAVAQALQIRLKGGELNRRKGGTQNLEAYELLLKANNASYQNTATSFDDVARYAQEAIDRDPNYGLAWSLLAYMNSTKADNALVKWSDGYPRARELALHALELSPDIAEAHALLEHLNVMLDWDWSAAQRERKLALAIDPTDPITLQVAAVNENALGRWDEAEKLIQTGLKRDPLASWLLWTLANTYYGAGRFDEAAATYRKLAEVEPNFQWTRMYSARVLQQQGDIEAASAVLEKETDPTMVLYFRPNLYWQLDRKEEADAALQQAIEQFGDINAYAIAQMYTIRGDLDRAFEWLEKAYEQKNSGLLEIVGEPLFKNLCGDPRFDAFMRRMNMPVVKSYPFRSGARS